MSAVDTRHISRDSLFLLAELRQQGQLMGSRVKVRNLSAGGMMAEGDMNVQRGDKLIVMLKNVGEINGSVAWVQDNRCGIAFAQEIDPKLVRERPEPVQTEPDRFIPTPYVPAPHRAAGGPVRKV